MSALGLSTLLEEPIGTVSGLTYRYPEHNTPALRNLTWAVTPGEFVTVTGPSGSGKSTLLRCLNGLTPHFSGGRFDGMVTVAGHDTRHYSPRVLARLTGFVFQDPEAQFVAGRVDDELAFGMEQLGVPAVTMRKRVEEVLDLLGIAALRDREIATLSGGERQRVAVAAALALQPSILALDEPTSQLDPWGAEEVLAALNRLNEDLGLTIVLAEHRLERVVAHADRLTVLAPRRNGCSRRPTERHVASCRYWESPGTVRARATTGLGPLAAFYQGGASRPAPRRRPRSRAHAAAARSCSPRWSTGRRTAAGECWMGPLPRAARRRSGGAAR